MGDPRVWYVIHNGQIWSRTTGWAPIAHQGDPHTTHIHVNLREDSQATAVAAENDTRSWFGTKAAHHRRSSPGRRRPHADHAQTRRLQQALIAKGYSIPAGPTGKYGAQTTAAVAAFQRARAGAGRRPTASPVPRPCAGWVSVGPVAHRGAVGPPWACARRRRRPGRQRPPPLSAHRRAAARGRGTRANGRLVYDLQNALIARGYSIPAGPTGYFGTRTKQAVAQFQGSLGFTGDQADGIPGTQTLRRLGL